MRTRIRFAFLAIYLVVAASAGTEVNANDQVASQLGDILYTGKLAQGEIDLEVKLAKDPQDGAVRASLGIVQFVKAVEELSQDYYRYGMEPQRGIAVGNMLIQSTGNPSPATLSYADARGILERFEHRLNKAEKTLSLFRFSRIKLPLDVMRITLDIHRDGELTGNVPFWQIVSVGSMGARANSPQIDNSLTFVFDDADVLWLRGYVHALLGTLNIALAHDWQDAFERTSHLFFSKPTTKYSFLLAEGEQKNWSINQIADLIALIHVINFDCIEPKRMQDALAHLEQVIALSRNTWKWIREETDNDREWLPGPTQNSIVLSGALGGPLGANWERVLDRTELILQGKELIPFWRGFEEGNALMFFDNNNSTKFHPELGVNLRKVFTHPERFDLVLWMQGTGVSPFLEKGKTIDLQAWQDLSQSFGGRLPFFSFWIN